MVKLVVDRSVAFKWFVEESLSSEARHILDGFRAGTFDVYVPDLMFAELGNILWKKERLHGLARQDALEIIQTVLQLGLVFVTSEALVEQAYALAIENGRTVYDSLYVALA